MFGDVDYLYVPVGVRGDVCESLVDEDRLRSYGLGRFALDDFIVYDALMFFVDSDGFMVIYFF